MCWPSSRWSSRWRSFRAPTAIRRSSRIRRRLLALRPLPDASVVGRLFAMAASVAVAFMFRHDHGLYLWAGGVLATLLDVESRSWKTAVRSAAIFTAIALLLVLPYLLYVQAYGGPRGVRPGRHRVQPARSRAPMARVAEDLRRRAASRIGARLRIPPASAHGHRGVARESRPQATSGGSPRAWLRLQSWPLLVNFSFIRDPLNTRLADAIVPAVMLGAWLASRAFSRDAAASFTIPMSLACAGLMAASVLAVGSTYDEIDRAGLLGHSREIPQRFAERTARPAGAIHGLPVAHAGGAPARAVFPLRRSLHVAGGPPARRRLHGGSALLRAAAVRRRTGVFRRLLRVGRK